MKIQVYNIKRHILALSLTYRNSAIIETTKKQHIFSFTYIVVAEYIISVHSNSKLSPYLNLALGTERVGMKKGADLAASPDCRLPLNRIGNPSTPLLSVGHKDMVPSYNSFCFASKQRKNTNGSFSSNQRMYV